MYILYTLSIDTADIIIRYSSQKIYASIELPPVIHIAACLTMLGPKRSWLMYRTCQGSTCSFCVGQGGQQKNEMNDSEMLMQVGNYLGVAWCGNYLFNPDSEPTKYGQCCGPFATQILKPWPVYPFDPFDSFEEFTSPAKNRKTIYI